MKQDKPKLIHIPQEDGTFQRLQMKAVKDGKNLKVYIQDLLINDSNKNN